ncbi:WG repeat-containing protein [Lacihabitans sp. LS3-19]|uniref:WG repeat-containing protein n=1 Tax=Lacihabitans sp. LS3-19 TaxID=2487335 RepID=UPI0020CE3EEC|nr:WG repeat-containing protein [Lacihabitans sp. LS3-19]
MGIINKKNEFLVPPIYDYIKNFNDGDFDGSNYGRDLTVAFNHANVVPIYDLKTGNALKQGITYYAIYNIKTKKMLYDLDSKITNFVLYSDHITKKPVYFFEKNQKWGIMDNDGRIVASPEFDELKGFPLLVFNNDRDLILAKKGNKYGIIEFPNKEILSFDYDKIEGPYVDVKDFNHLFMVRKNGKAGVTEITNKKILDCKYQDINILNPGCFIVKNNNKKGIINNKGELILDIVYEDIPRNVSISEEGFFKEISVKSNGKWGLINSKQNFIVTAKYDEPISGFLFDFQENQYSDFTYVVKNKLKGVVDTSGLEIIEPKFGSVIHIKAQKTKYFQVSKNSYPSFSSNDSALMREGNILITDFKFHNFYFDQLGNIVACMYDSKFEYKSKCGLINQKGESILPIIFRDIKYDQNSGVYVTIDNDGKANNYKIDGSKFSD